MDCSPLSSRIQPQILGAPSRMAYLVRLDRRLCSYTIRYGNNPSSHDHIQLSGLYFRTMAHNIADFRVHSAPSSSQCKAIKTILMNLTHKNRFMQDECLPHLKSLAASAISSSLSPMLSPLRCLLNEAPIRSFGPP